MESDSAFLFAELAPHFAPQDLYCLLCVCMYSCVYICACIYICVCMYIYACICTPRL